MIIRNLQLIRRTSCRALSIDFKSLPDHKALVVEKFGDPQDVILQIRKPEEVLPKELGPKQVLVEHLSACINPADINMIQGLYGFKPKLPAIIGNEGIMRIQNVGSDVTDLKPGDLALGATVFGYWQSYSVQHADDMFKVDNDLDVNVAAQLKVNPCTAYRMLKDFRSLHAGDTIIQNGANSAVGVYAIQLARMWGIKTINVIRDRPNKEEVVQELKDYGADYVLTEEEVSNVEVLTPILKESGRAKILLNCVGGKNARNCERALDHGGYIITYGAMSKQPLSVSAAGQIFKRLQYHGFWVSDWFREKKRDEIAKFLNEIGDMFKKGLLRSKSTRSISFEERNIAFGSSNNTKFLFSINKR